MADLAAGSFNSSSLAECLDRGESPALAVLAGAVVVVVADHVDVVEVTEVVEVAEAVVVLAVFAESVLGCGW
jgi:hypothetical protein